MLLDKLHDNILLVIADWPMGWDCESLNSSIKVC